MKIVYETNTGSCERYAKMLSEKMGLEAVSLSSTCEGDADEVVFIGWIMAGTIQGLETARKNFASIKAVCAVGMMPPESQLEKLKEKNLVTEQIFALPGAFDMKKLSGMYKMMMGMMMRMLKSQFKDSENEKEREAYALFEKGFDAVKEENLNEVLKFLEK